MKLTQTCLAVTIAVTALSVSAEGFFDTLKNAVSGNYTVRGRVQVQDGQWLTCFVGNNTGYLGPSTLARPGDAQTDPVTGNIKITTSAIPTIIMTRDGTVTSNDCDALATQGLLMGPEATAPSATAQSGGKIRDKYGCGEWTDEEFRVADKGEIMACQARVITDREYARLQAERQAASSAAPAPGVAAVNVGSDPARQAAFANLQQDTAAKFKALQAQSSMPAAAPAQSDEDLAWDGAKLCGLKPAYMMKLKEEALRFVRLDQASAGIVLSEMAGGVRQEVTLDGNAFAQRASFNAQAIGQGGDICGRAFWNAEAFKAASLAMSGG